MTIEGEVYKKVRESELPVSAQHIALELDVGWGTALRYCLELLAADRIKGVKTTKSWIFWVEEAIRKGGEPCSPKHAV